MVAATVRVGIFLLFRISGRLGQFPPSPVALFPTGTLGSAPATAVGDLADGRHLEDEFVTRLEPLRHANKRLRAVGEADF